MSNLKNNVGAGFRRVARGSTRVAVVGGTIGAIAYLTQALSQKRDKFNTGGIVDSTLFDKNQQYYTTISIGTYKRSLFDSVNPLNAFLKIATIFSDGGYRLPLPLKLIDKNIVQWEAKSLIDASKGMEKVNELAAGKASQVGNITGAVQALSGLAPNEFLTMLFKGPSYKKFTLQFLISPNTPKQSEAFREMVVRFKNSMSPSLTALGAVFKYPNVFQISFNKTTGSGPFLYEFKPAVLESFTVDYAPANVPSFYTGTDEPESFVLNMDFCEIEFWLAGDFK
jgi:hypothetical protein